MPARWAAGVRVPAQHSEEPPHNRSTNPSDYRVLLGYNQLSHPTEHSRQMTVNRIMVHADYNKWHRMGSDITLLQLHCPVEFSSHILPACLPEPTTSLAPDSACWISGWGMVTEDGEQCSQVA